MFANRSNEIKCCLYSTCQNVMLIQNTITEYYFVLQSQCTLNGRTITINRLTIDG